MSAEKIESYIDFQVDHIAIGFLPNKKGNEVPVDTTPSKSWCCCCGSIFQSLLESIVDAYASTLSYKHCEIAILLNDAAKKKFGSDKVAALGIVNDENTGVFFKLRNFHREYEWQYVSVTREELQAIVAFGRSQIGKPFSLYKTTMVAIWPGRETREAYYCAHFTMACLELIGKADFQLNSPNKMTIDDIYTLITEDANRASVRKMVPVHEKTTFANTNLTIREKQQIKI
jgi:hypothetical protein